MAEKMRGSAEWWLDRLYGRLLDRLPLINLYDDYYKGEHPLPWLHESAEDEFRRILRMTRTNVCGLVVDAQAERMTVEGVRIGTKPSGDMTARLDPQGQVQISGGDGDAQTGFEADDETWRIWQANNLDAGYAQGMLEAAITGNTYLLVAPNDDDPKTPHIFVEHASQCIVEHVPGSNRTKAAAGLKAWVDDVEGKIFATVYLPDAIYKYAAPLPKMTKHSAEEPSLEFYARPHWEPRVVEDEDWPLTNRWGEVTLYESPNNPRLLTGGRSELEDVLDPQDRINKTVADRLMTQDFGAFPRLWATGYPLEDSAGSNTEPIDMGRDRILATDVKETRFGQFATSPLDPYSEAKAQDTKDIASRTRTPAQYLLGDMSNVNGETLKASESGLVAKVRQRMRGHEGPLERALSMARRMAGISTPQDAMMEIIWRNPEFRTEGELMDALVKARQGLDVPREATWERWGATPVEIGRWRAMRLADIKEQMSLDPAVALAATYRSAANGVPGAGAPQPGRGRPVNAADERADKKATRSAAQQPDANRNRQRTGVGTGTA